MTKRILESMTKVYLDDGTVVRVWRQEPLEYEPSESTNNSLKDLVFTLEGMPPRKMADVLISQPDINAVEVLDDNGNGIVLYSEWP